MSWSCRGGRFRNSEVRTACPPLDEGSVLELPEMPYHKLDGDLPFRQECRKGGNTRGGVPLQDEMQRRQHEKQRREQ
jgi:hypothetical protein